jgi:hypothetical protein
MVGQLLFVPGPVSTGTEWPNKMLGDEEKRSLVQTRKMKLGWLMLNKPPDSLGNTTTQRNIPIIQSSWLVGQSKSM